MALAIVTIAGRTYRMGCDEGQEKRLEELAALVDGKIAAMKGSFGEIGDQRIVVMAALQIADEAADARDRVAALEAELASARAHVASAQARESALETRLEQALGDAAGRIEQLVRDLSRAESNEDSAEIGLPSDF
ncbi:cell division protein ZapA [Methylocystis heyeri]|uniref:Cell division protein ZapA n=1 Tax=Methylocystis heyeri TaxID=391905 RepID=A0A6B8KD36_9HYPH|nr:cell division protein ZapA [Methylocystis heyeri]QGM45597.1 cell division protein ZapA [Methylocystis heyeri]